MARASYKDWITEEGQTLLEGWARSGLTFEQIAKNIGCTPQTLRIWRQTHPSIYSAIKKGAEVVDLEVEDALRKRAVGYTVTETKKIVQEVDGARTIKQEIIERHIPPDTAAAIFWLKNRCSERWSNVEPSTKRKQVAEARLAEERLKELSTDKDGDVNIIIDIEKPDDL